MATHHSPKSPTQVKEYQEAPKSNVIGSEISTGQPRRRAQGVSTAKMTNAQTIYLLTQAQRETFEQWFENDIADGALAFNSPRPRGGVVPVLITGDPPYTLSTSGEELPGLSMTLQFSRAAGELCLYAIYLPRACATCFDQHTGSAMFALVSFYEPNGTMYARVVNNTENITHNGAEYIGLPFALTLPSSNDEQIPQLTLKVSNVERTLVELLRGVSEPPNVYYRGRAGNAGRQCNHRAWPYGYVAMSADVASAASVPLRLHDWLSG